MYLKIFFSTIYIFGCFFRFSQSLWRKIQELDLSRYVKYRHVNDINPHTAGEGKKATQWFLWAIDLLLIALHLVKKTWTNTMDEYTPNYVSGVNFNDYLVSTYVDRTSSLYPIHLWNQIVLLLIIFQERTTMWKVIIID